MKRSKWLLPILAAILLFRIPTFLSRTCSNAGIVLLTHAMLPVGNPLAITANPATTTQAKRWLDRAVAIERRNRLAYHGLALALATTGQEEEAVEVWRLAEPTPDDLARLVDTVTRLQNTSGVVRWDRWAPIFEELAEQRLPDQPGSSEIYYEWSRILFDQTESPEYLLKILTIAIEQDRFFEATHRVEAHFLRAEVLRRMKHWKEALQDYEWVTSIGEHYGGSWMWPIPYWAWIHQGHIYWEIYENPQKARYYFEAAIKFNPQEKWAYLSLGALFQKQGRSEEAKTMFRKVLQLDPCDETAHSVLDAGDTSCSPK